MNPISRSGVQEDNTRPSLHAKYFYDKKHFGHEITDDEDDEDYDVEYANENHDGDVHEGKKSNNKRKKISECANCHSKVGRSEPESNENFIIKMTSNNHNQKLCQLCKKYFTIQSGSDCDSFSNKSSCSSMDRSRVSNSSLSEKNHNNLNTAYQNYEMQSLTIHKQALRHCLREESSKTKQLSQADLCFGWNMAHPNAEHLKKSYSNYYDQLNKNDNELILTEMIIRGKVIGDCSRRPIQCPRLDCAINVAFSSLTHHFLFDHPEVPILGVEPGDKSTLVISSANLSCDSNCCLAVLLVSSKFMGPESKLFNGNQIHPKYCDRLPLPVFAARLHHTDSDTITNDVNFRDESNGKSDIILAWVSGLDITNIGVLHCTIQAVDNLRCNGIRSLTYRGPINSLRRTQRPKEVFLTGDCLILHKGVLKHLTTDSSTLNINVTIHI